MRNNPKKQKKKCFFEKFFENMGYLRQKGIRGAWKMGYKEAIISLINAVENEEVLKIIYAFLTGFLN